MLIGTVSPYNEMFPGKWTGSKIGLKGSRALAQAVLSRFQIVKLVSNQYWARSANGIELQRAPLGFELNPQK